MSDSLHFHTADTAILHHDALPDGLDHHAAIDPYFGHVTHVNDSTRPVGVLLVPGDERDAAIDALIQAGITPYEAITGDHGTVEVDPLLGGGSSHLPHRVD